MNENTKNQAPSTRMKTPNTKIQIPKNFQFPNFKLRRAGLIQGLEVGVWDLFGVWNLGFGALAYH
jgi:hypothetical protein